MNSLRQTATSHDDQQAALRAQIAALQAQLDPDAVVPEKADTKENRERERKRVLVGESPVKEPSKKRKLEYAAVLPTKPLFPRPVNAALGVPMTSSTSTAVPTPPQPRPSNVLSMLHKLHAQPEPVHAEPAARSNAFAEPAVPRSTPSIGVPQRDADLTIVESLEPGPREFKAPPEDLRFERFEPNSGIRLSSRRVSHDDVQSYLSGRFFLPPSLLYSVVRLTPDKQAYDVPVSGDWVTIAVVAERGEVKVSRGGPRKDGEASSEDEDGGKKTWRDRAKQKEKEKEREKAKGKDAEASKPQGKKYITLKLVDFGNRAGGSGTGSCKGATARGDAQLSLLLFEANTVQLNRVEEDDELTQKKLYKGGSGGAFEVWASTLREGSVVALLNPRVLRPFQRGDNKPHPIDNVLALTPNTAEAIVVLGQSLDLARCTARRKDGNQCSGWCDKRVNEVCEYHIQQRVKSLRAARPEFTAGTSGFTTSRPSSGPDYQRKQGLLPAGRTGPMAAPRDSGGGPTYIMEGHVLRSNARAAAPQVEFVGEKLGRERAERDLRKNKKSKMDEELKEMLGGKTKLTFNGMKIGRTEAGDSQSDPDDRPRVTTAYKADTVKKIGFNPGLMGRGAHAEVTRRKAEAKNRDVHALLDRRDLHIQPKLRAPPGTEKIRSGVSVPAHLADPPKEAIDQEDNSLSDLEISDPQPAGVTKTPPAQAADNESSDLEIEGLDGVPNVALIKRRET